MNRAINSFRPVGAAQNRDSAMVFVARMVLLAILLHLNTMVEYRMQMSDTFIVNKKYIGRADVPVTCQFVLTCRQLNDDGTVNFSLQGNSVLREVDTSDQRTFSPEAPLIYERVEVCVENGKATATIKYHDKSRDRDINVTIYADRPVPDNRTAKNRRVVSRKT